MSIGSLAARAGIAKKKTVRECLAHLVDEQLIEQHDVNDIHEDWFHLPCNKTQGYFYTIKLAGYPQYDVTQPMPAEVRELLAQPSGYISPTDKGAKMDPLSIRKPKNMSSKGAKMDPPKNLKRGPISGGSILAPSKSGPDQESFYQENPHQETKEEEGVVQGSIDDANDIDGETPPPPDLILEHQGTPLAAREGILPAEEETPTVKDSEPEDPDVRWKKPWKENLEPRADRMRTIYSSAELRKIWELGMDVYPTLWGYKVGDDELVAKWLVYKVGDLVSRKVKTGSWYKSLVDIEECSAWCAKNSNAAPSFVPTSGSHTPTAEELEERKRSRHAAIMADWNEKKAREAASEGGES